MRNRSGATTSRRESIPSRALLAICFTTEWFKRDRYGLTIGGGQINNPGRYLVLLPPINGETAESAAINAPYFTGNPSDPFKAWDTSITFDYMPRQCITFRWEYDYRHASVPYWSGPGRSYAAWFGRRAVYQQRISAIFCLQRWEYVRIIEPERRTNRLRRTGQQLCGFLTCAGMSSSLT